MEIQEAIASQVVCSSTKKQCSKTKKKKRTKQARVVAIIARVPEYWAILQSRIRSRRWMVTFPGVYKGEVPALKEERSQGISEEAKRGETGGQCLHHRNPLS